MPNLRFASWFLCKGTKKMNKLCKSFDFNLLLILKKDGFAKPTWQIMFNSELCSMWKLETNMQNSLVNLNDWLMFRKRLTLKAFYFIQYCQENSEFWTSENRKFWNWKEFSAKMAKKWCFQKWLIVNDFRFLYIFTVPGNDAFGLSELCFEPLTCGKWACQMPLMTRSKATNDNLRSHMWQIWRLKVKEEKYKSKYSLHISFPDWMKKLTRICHNFSYFSIALLKKERLRQSNYLIVYIITTKKGYAGVTSRIAFFVVW